MIKIGEFNDLTAFRQTDNGVYLRDPDGQEVLLPNKYVPENLEMGTEMTVFVFNDSEDRPTATTLQPKILLHQFAWLCVVEVNNYGAFLDWGLEKDLLVPFSQQKKRMKAGESYLVCMYKDEVTDRLVASSKIIDFFSRKEFTLTEGEEVDILLGEKTELGYQVIVNQAHSGMIYDNEIFTPVQSGQQLKGFVKQIRDDGKLDISLQQTGYKAIPTQARSILQLLEANDGFFTAHR